MSHGFGLTHADGLARYAEALTTAGVAVLAYDNRYTGASDGAPRQRIRMSEQLQDRLSAIAFVRNLDRIDPDEVIVWGYSLSGGTSIEAVAADSRIAGAILLCPFTDGRWRCNRSARTQPRNTLWTMGRAITDAVIPVSAEPGSHGGLTFPGEYAGFRQAVGPGWRNEVHAGMALPLPYWRPVSHARKLNCPILIQSGLRDISVSPRAIDRLAQRAPYAVLKRYDVDHFEPFYGERPAQIVADQVEWLKSWQTVGR
jgi:pimeloyl-ACP methyl ester carboxylesterase